MASPLVIDGSTLEGGGQILRNSVALAALLSKPIQVVNIRANRKSSGLKSQHAAGIKLVGDITGATIEGAETGSHTLTFTPGRNLISVNRRTFSADAKTAGSTTLLLQISLPCLLYGPSDTSTMGDDTLLNTADLALLTVKGGTNAANAPAVDYTQHIFLPFIRKHLGLNPTLKIRKRGFYPKGGGELFMRIPPVAGPLKAFNLTSPPGRVIHIKGRAFVAGALPIAMAKQMTRAAHDTLREAEELKSAWPTIEIEAVKENDSIAVGSGSGVFLWAETEDGCIYGGTSIGQKGRDTAKVGKEAAYELLKGLLAGGCVDEYLQDQLIIFMVLAEGISSLRTGPLTLHTRTAIWVAEQLTGVHFEVDESQESHCIIRVTGIGHTTKACHFIG